MQRDCKDEKVADHARIMKRRLQTCSCSKLFKELHRHLPLPGGSDGGAIQVEASLVLQYAAMACRDA